MILVSESPVHVKKLKFDSPSKLPTSDTDIMYPIEEIIETVQVNLIWDIRGTGELIQVFKKWFGCFTGEFGDAIDNTFEGKEFHVLSWDGTEN